MKILITIITVLLLLPGADAQQTHFYFRKLRVADGLNDGGTIAISQDSKGFMWFSTRAGLNRFDGYSVKTYSHIAGDPSSLPTSICRVMSVDSSGGFLAGLEDGMLEYEEDNDRFLPIKALQGTWILQIFPFNKNTVFLSTRSGLVKYDPVSKKAIFYRDGGDPVFNAAIYSADRKDNFLYIATTKGLYRFDMTSELLKEIQIPALNNETITTIKIDGHHNYWILLKDKNGFIKIAPDLKQYESFPQFPGEGKNTIQNFTSIITDKKGRPWVTTQLQGLLFYNENSHSFEQFLHDPLKVWTASTNLHSNAFCDKDGIIWVAGNNGINYFDPGKNLFSILPVFNKDPDIRNRRVARVATEDKNGRIWMGSIDGLVRFDPSNNEYREWNNREGHAPVIHFNSVRGVLCDEENNIWIATGHGINKYLQAENKMIFYTSKDSAPEVFYFSVDKDRAGNTWFSTRDADGFYYYNQAEKKFHSIRSFPGLDSFAGEGGRKLFQDSKGRYWLGFNGSGAGMYDPSTRKHYRWRASVNEKKGIAGSAIVDITEDKNGFIWISSFTGLTSIDPINFSIKNYNHTNGLINNSVSALFVDDRNRLWIATGSGLQVLDSNRNYFTNFGLQHGLPSIEFPEHAASVLRSGDVMMPTQNGFIRFAANQFTKETAQLQAYFTGLTISGKTEQPLLKENIHLRYDENFFTIGFAAINYNDAGGTWYAYKLEGVDEDWQYTQNRFAGYTQLPGGNYTFRVKASTDRTQWNGEEKKLAISIVTVFYKTWWFRTSILLLLLAFSYWFYRYRLHQQRRLLELQGKAQLLEKEKVMVMYENLKQQLNPHFLFNSLTSLSGLIEADQKMAGNFLEQMSKIYRYILKNRDSELVTLKEEISFVQTYINLQKTRFKDGLQFKIMVEEDDLYKKIAPVTLQNLVENAMKHNIIDRDSPLVIEIRSSKGYLEVKNNLQKKSVVETSNRQGLASLRSLYQYLHHKPVLTEETTDAFIIRIPLIVSI